MSKTPSDKVEPTATSDQETPVMQEPDMAEAPAPVDAETSLELLLERVAVLEVALATVVEEKADADGIIADLQEAITDAREAGSTDLEPAAEILYDPFYSKNPYDVIGEIEPNSEYPEGAVIAWKNISNRNGRRGWRGWDLFHYGDEYTGDKGELLSNYIPDPPPRLAGGAVVDTIVRRADSGLGRLDKRIFESRQRMRELNAEQQWVAVGSGETTVLGEHTKMTGSGMREQERPRGGFKVGEKSPMPVGEHVVRTVHKVTK